SLGIITVDQSPPVISVQPNDTVKILCRASRDIGDDMSLHQLKPGQAPKQLIYYSTYKMPASLGIITVDQSPPVISVQPHNTVNILCRASRDIGDDMELYQLKPGQAPKHLIHDSTSRRSGVPDRFSASLGIITVDQSPPVISVQPHDTVKILCRASQDIGSDMELYQLKPGQAPKLLIYDGTSRRSGVPDRFSASLGIITVDQSPSVISVQPHETVKILCRASEDIGNDMELYQLKPGQAPKLIIHDSNSRVSGVPERFSGTLTGALTTFTITGVQLEDEAEYHCQQTETLPLTQ
ncbi:hypothetical protein NFI96_032168, partial [Prochilodus magdalenae]